MISYLLLAQPGKDSTNVSYHGTYRPGPAYVRELPEDAPVNKLWMIESGPMPNEPLANFEEATTIQSVYAKSGIALDLVMTMEKDEIPPTNIPSHYMGFDISHRSGYSLLSWDLNFSEPAPEFFHQRHAPVYQPLLSLIERYFRPRLNMYRLLPTQEDAEFFLSVASAMTQGFGTVWEDPQYGPFVLVKMYMVRSREQLLPLNPVSGSS